MSRLEQYRKKRAVLSRRLLAILLFLLITAAGLYAANVRLSFLILGK